MISSIFQKTYSFEDLPQVANDILPLLKENNVWLLRGQMGAGKTTLTHALIDRISTEPFKGSPTFALVNVYDVRENFLPIKRLYHFDLYRLNAVEEAWDIGAEEMWQESNAISIIEWPEKAESILPQNHVSLEIEILSPTHRRLTIKK